MGPGLRTLTYFRLLIPRGVFPANVFPAIACVRGACGDKKYVIFHLERFCCILYFTFTAALKGIHVFEEPVLEFLRYLLNWRQCVFE